MIDTKLLASLEPFREVDASVVDALCARGRTVSYAPGEVIFLAGSEPRGWFVVLDGLVRVVQGSGDRQHVVHSERAGGTLGEVPLFTGEPHPATAIAAEPTRCAHFDRKSLEAAIGACPEIAFVMMRRLALRTHALVHRLNERSARSVRARLVEFLLERSEQSTRSIFSTGMTQQALAEELGTVREVVSREVRRLVADGLIVSHGGGRYEIVDMAAMRREASG